MEQLFSKLVAAVAGDKAAPTKDYWVDDSKCKACYECETPFSMLVRRHHCRVCGRIFCANCTVTSAPSAKSEAPPGQSWQRICNYCEWAKLGKNQKQQLRGPSFLLNEELICSTCQ
jgi:hypothetical protein